MSLGGTNISETKLESLKIQSSTYGATVALLAGVARIPGNLLYYDDFTAIPHTDSTGGKGGGGRSTTYTYEAGVLMALCHGSISDIPRIWRGKKVYTEAAVGAAQVLTVEETYAVPPTGGAYTVAFASEYTGVVTVTSWASFPDEWGWPDWQTVTLSQGLDYSVDAGVFTFPDGSRACGFTATIRYTRTIPPVAQTALAQLGLTLYIGGLGQSPAGWVTTNHPDKAIHYPSLAYVGSPAYDLGSAASVENHSFEIVGPGAYELGASIPDIDPAPFLLSLLLDTRYGARLPATFVASADAWSAYCRANNLLMSPALTTQAKAAEVATRMAELTNTAPVWSSGQLKFIPYGDTAASGNGASYTPNLTPIYDLSIDVFIASRGASPVKVTRKKPSEAYNHIRIEFQNRANGYAVEIAEAKDQADIDSTGLRSAPILKADWICDVDIARNVAQLMLQRSLYVRASYEFQLPWNFTMLEPMDLVTLTLPEQGLNLTPVRITNIGESGGNLNFTAENFALGVAHAPIYTTQVAVGFAHDYNVTPGDVSPPFMFEAPVNMTLTGLEVWAAVRGASATWGGCSVWVSMDGTNYRRVRKLDAAARYGAITGPVAAGVLPVSISGALTSGSAADAAALQTLCYVGGASPEYLAFETAALTGPGAYNLGGLSRAAYGTAADAHTTNDPFVRIDDAIAKSDPLDLAMVGKQIFFKFTSVNLYGVAEQSLADVTAYPYTITGAMVALAPSEPTGLAATQEKTGVRVRCNPNPEPDIAGYEWRVGASWATATVLDALGGTSYLLAMSGVGSQTVWVAAVDALGNRSIPASIAVAAAAPTVSSLVFSVSGRDLVLTYGGTPGAFAIAGYEVRYGDVYGSATVVGTFSLNKYQRPADWTGARRWWVAAVDIEGNIGAAVSVDATISPPGAVTLARAEVIDNNVLLYWQPPASGTLPVDRYEVRKGSSWATGSVVGSNGNSTFAAVFEQSGGTFHYWIAAIDTAEGVGTATEIPATVNQPPDYVLRANIDSVFGGTLVNFMSEAGTLLGPVDTAESWATHFSSRGWTSPQDQINAGYPLYAEPSLTSASYSEDTDHGAVLPSTVISSTLGATTIAGTLTASCQIYYKTLAGDAWTAGPAGATSVLAAGFRYTRVVWTVTCTSGANLIRVTSLNIKLSIKLKNDSGSGAVTTAATGVAVTFGLTFAGADTPIVQPDGTTPLIPVVDYAGGANPTGFTVFLYTLAGVKTTGSFSWSVRGY